MSASGTVSGEEARDPLVLAIDVGTSSVRAFVYDARGDMVESWGGRRAYEVHSTADGGVEIDADQLVDLVADCVTDALKWAGSGAGRITAVGCDTFWHSLMGVTADGRAATPISTWADTRSTPGAEALRAKLDPAEVHRRTGAVLHSSYLPAKLMWLRMRHPDVVGRVRYWMSSGEYLYLRLFGERRVSISMASGTGLLVQRTCEWDGEVLDAVGVDVGSLSPLAEFTQSFSGPRAPFAERWPDLRDVPWYLAVGDGAANNLGSGGGTPEWWVVMVGTSGALRVVSETTDFDVPSGLWSYRVDRRRIIQGGALSSGGNVFAWLSHALQVPAVSELEQELAAMEPDSHGLTMLPFLAGERSPSWNANAKGGIYGLTLATSPVDIVRAALEAIAYRFAAVEHVLRSDASPPRGIIGSGSGLLDSPAWMQIMSDVLAQPLIASAVPEASSRGAALLALEAEGAIADAVTVHAPLGTTYAPVDGRTAIYQSAMKRQQDFYAKLVQ